MPHDKESLARFDMETCYTGSASYRKDAVDTMKTGKAIIDRLGLGSARQGAHARR